MGQLRSSEVKKWERRQRRAWHVRSTVYGTENRPRLSVYRSNKHFHAQIIDDQKGTTLAAASTTMKELRDDLKHGGGIEAAEVVGAKLAEIAKEKGIIKVVFDRNFYNFHGRVRSFAESAAKGGLDFLTNPKKKNKVQKEKNTGGSAAKKEEKEKRRLSAQKGNK
mgnify:FL=1